MCQDHSGRTFMKFGRLWRNLLSKLLVPRRRAGAIYSAIGGKVFQVDNRHGLFVSTIMFTVADVLSGKPFCVIVLFGYCIEVTKIKCKN